MKNHNSPRYTSEQISRRRKVVGAAAAGLGLVAAAKLGIPVASAANAAVHIPVRVTEGVSAMMSNPNDAVEKRNAELSKLPAAWENVTPGKGAESAIGKLYREGNLTEDELNDLSHYVDKQGSLPGPDGLPMLDANQRVMVPELPGLPLKSHENVPTTPTAK